MDPVSALGLVSSCVAIFDGLKEAYRFGRDVIRADDERQEFDQRLNYVKTVTQSLDTLIASEKAHPGPASVALLDLELNVNSPLKGLEECIKKMNIALKLKDVMWKKQLKNFQWRSEKKTLEQCFVEIDGYCAGISAILVSVNISLSNNNFAVSQETNLITKTLAAKFEEDREVTKRIQEETMIIQAKAQKEKDDLERKKIEDWLSPFDFQARRLEKLEDAAPTGKCFLESPEFENWKDGEVQLLRCYGPTGAGKTILSAIVLEHLVKELPNETPVLCIFFEQKPAFPLTLNNILGSLLKQLLQVRECTMPIGIKDAYDKATRLRARLTSQEMKSLLQAEFDVCEKLYIVVDALDEAPDESRDLIERHIRKLCPDKLKMMTTRREDIALAPDMITCSLCSEKSSELVFWYHCVDCPEAEGRMDLCQSCRDSHNGCPVGLTHRLSVPKVVEKKIYTPEADLKSFVETVIRKQMPDIKSDEDDPAPRRGTTPKLPWACYLNPSLLTNIVEAVARASGGRFLLAKQYTRSLSSKQSTGDIKRAIKEINRASADLGGNSNSLLDMSESINKMYEDDMTFRIQRQEYEKVKYAMRILAIVSTARRNLRLRELTQALATWDEETTTELDPEDEAELDEILNVTKGLIRIERDQDKIVRLDHRTLEEYFDKTRSIHFPNSEIDMARICLKFLNFDIFEKPCDRIEDFAAKEQSLVFISYAVQYWGDHVRESTSGELDNSEVVKAAVSYLQSPLRLEAYIQAGWASNTLEHAKWDVRRTIYPLHVCAWFDMSYLISALDYKNLDLDVPENTYGQTALMYACRRGNERVARRLMELGASVNHISGRRRTALYEAVLAKNQKVITLLLSQEFKHLKIDVNIVNERNFSRTPLMVAAHGGQLEIVRELLTHDEISLNLADSEGNTALALASSEGHLEVVSALLSTGRVDLNIQEKQFGRSALSWAAEYNHPHIVEALLSRGAKAELEDMRGGYAALRAAEEGCIEALQKLLSCDVDVTRADEDGCTPLHLASAKGHVEILRVIVSKYSDIDVRDQIGMTPFHRACQSGKLETGRLLVDMGADVDTKDKFQRTPTIVAWQYGRQDLVRLCRIRGATNAVDTHHLQVDSLPLWSLVVRRDVTSVESALSADPSVLALKEDGTENTVLHLALIQQNGDEDPEDEVAVQLLKTLLPAAHRCLDDIDNCGRSPLHLAAQFGNIEAVKVLLDHDPQLSELDRFGLTPLALAFRNGHYPVAVILIEAGSDISTSKVDVQNMLFKSIELQNVRAVEFLVNAGANATIPDEFGRTINQLAELSGESRLKHLVQSIKSSMWQAKRVGTTKASGSTTVEVVEIVSANLVTANQFPTVSQLPIRNIYESPISNERETISMCA